MKFFLRIFVLLMLILILRLALDDEGDPYHPIKDGMGHDTTGEEWSGTDKKKKQP